LDVLCAIGDITDSGDLAMPPMLTHRLNAVAVFLWPADADGLEIASAII
jgi:hypothetical protein